MCLEKLTYLNSINVIELLEYHFVCLSNQLDWGDFKLFVLKLEY